MQNATSVQREEDKISCGTGVDGRGGVRQGGGVKFSKKSEYGVGALVEIALRSQSGVGWHQISQVAEATRIPEKFLEQILLALKNGGLLKSRRGIEGGYALNLPPGEIRMDQVVALLDGAVQLEVPSANPSNPAVEVFHKIAVQAQTAAQEVLRNTSLADVLQQVQARRAATGQGMEYQI